MKCILCKSANTQTFFERTDKHYGQRLYWQCQNCALIFLDPQQRLSRAQEQERYDLHENDPEDQGYVDHLCKLVDPLHERLKPGEKGLDFGSGPGPTISIILKARGFDVQNYDSFYHPQEDLLDDTYDFITCSEVVEHFYDPRKEFERFDKLMKTPNGLLGVMTQFYDPQTDFAKWWYHTEPTHVCFYQPQTLHFIADWLNWKLDIPTQNIAIFQK